MAWFDKLRKGFEEVVEQVDGARSEIVAAQCYKAGRTACESEFASRSLTEAIADLEEAAKADSDFRPDAKRWLARAYEAQGDLERSRQAYLEATELLEEDDTNRLRAWIAAEYNMDPDDYVSELHDELATQLAGQGRHDEVIYHARRAVEANRENLNAYHTFIASLHATGDTQEVRRWLMEARNRDNLGLVDQWVADLGIDESIPTATRGVDPLSQFESIELPGLQVEDDDG